MNARWQARRDRWMQQARSAGMLRRIPAGSRDNLARANASLNAIRDNLTGPQKRILAGMQATAAASA